MALRDAMRENAAPYLEPGEQIQAVIGAQTASQYWAVLGGVLGLVFFAKNRYRVIVATDRRLLVLDTGKWSQKKVRGVVTELPRATRLGPTDGIWHAMQIGDETLRSHRRFHKDIAAADAAIGVPQA